MPLVTTLGGSSANSFITVSEADSYLAVGIIFDTSAWHELTIAEKEERLEYAALMMKTQFMWIGWPVFRRQALPFPRWMPDEQDFAAEDIFVPDHIKKAQAYLALDVVHRGAVGLTPPEEGNPKPHLKRLSLFGSLDVTLTESLGRSTEPTKLGRLSESIHFLIEQLLAPYVTSVQCTDGRCADHAPHLLDEVS